MTIAPQPPTIHRSIAGKILSTIEKNNACFLAITYGSSTTLTTHTEDDAATRASGDPHLVTTEQHRNIPNKMQ